MASASGVFAWCDASAICYGGGFNPAEYICTVILTGCPNPDFNVDKSELSTETLIRVQSPVVARSTHRVQTSAASEGPKVGPPKRTVGYPPVPAPVRFTRV